MPGIGTHLTHGSQEAGVAVSPGDLAHVALHLPVQVQSGGLGLSGEGASEPHTAGSGAGEWGIERDADGDRRVELSYRNSRTK